MWARIVETMFCLWLYVSPFVFSYPEGDEVLWTLTYGIATLAATTSLLAFLPRFRHANAVTLSLALVLGGCGYFLEGADPSPAYQNLLVVGLLIGMSAALPSHASVPPLRWQEFYERRARSQHHPFSNAAQQSKAR